MTFDELFNKCTTTTKRGDKYHIACKKRLWGVTAPTREEAEKEARWYFYLYLSDGEYGRF